jgi:hypothetical protein
MMDSTNVDIQAIKEYMLDNFSGLDTKRFNKLESAVVSKNNSKKYDANPGMDWTEACVAVLMALEDPVKYNLDNMLDRFDTLPEAARSHSVSFADHVKVVGDALIHARLITADDLQPVSAALVTGSLSDFASRANGWLGDDSITTTRIMTRSELVNDISFQIAVETAKQVGKHDYTDFPVYNKKLEALAEIGIKHGHDISGLAAVISPESILNLYKKHHKELDKVLPLITDKNRLQVASYLHDQGEKRAFDALMPHKVTPTDKKHIAEFTSLLADLNKHAETLFKEADSNQDVFLSPVRLSSSSDHKHHLLDQVINRMVQGKMNYELFDSIEQTTNKFKALKEQYTGNVHTGDEPKSFFSYVLNALISMFKTKVNNKIMNERIDRTLENFVTVAVAKEERREESTALAVSTDVASEVTTTEQTQQTVKGTHTEKQKKEQEQTKKQDPNIVYI